MRGHWYFASGVTLASDHPIPGLFPIPPLERATVRVHFHALPAWRDAPIDPASILRREPADPALPAALEIGWVAGGAGTRFQLPDGAEFFIDADGANVWCRWEQAHSVDDVVGYVAGSVLGYVLRLRGTLALHASGVIIQGRAIGFVGPSGAGKSTLAAACCATGAALCTDDVLAIGERDGGVVTWRGGDHLRLASQSVRGVGAVLGRPPDWEPATFGLVGPTWDKHMLPMPAASRRFQGAVEGAVQGAVQDPIPLRALFRVTPHVDPVAPEVVRVAAPEALLMLLPHTSSAHLLAGTQAARSLAQLSRLVERLPVYRIEFGPGYEQLPHAVHAIRRALDD